MEAFFKKASLEYFKGDSFLSVDFATARASASKRLVLVFGVFFPWLPRRRGRLASLVNLKLSNLELMNLESLNLDCLKLAWNACAR